MWTRCGTWGSTAKCRQTSPAPRGIGSRWRIGPEACRRPLQRQRKQERAAAELPFPGGDLWELAEPGLTLPSMAGTSGQLKLNVGS